MKRDFFSSNKRISTSLKTEHTVADNTSSASYRDITKREKILSLKKSLVEKRDFSIRLFIQNMSERGNRALKKLTQKHIYMVVLLILLAYFVYGIGFAIRTESRIQSLLAHPQILLEKNGSTLVRAMFQDYQIIAPLIQNPLFPIEPIASYGKGLSLLHKIVGKTDQIKSLEKNFLHWKSSYHTSSIFPLLDDSITWLRYMHDEMKIIGNITPLGNFGNFWIKLYENRALWYIIFGKYSPTRILLLNQNSDEIRAGGGFPGTAFIIEFDQGKMTRFDFYDIYALDWNLRGYRPSPEGINQLNSIEYPGKPIEFEIRDANYYPLFRDSAVKITELAHSAGIGNLDIVVGVNQKILQDIVRLIEPIYLPGMTVPLDHENVSLVLSLLVEGKKTLKKTPKETVKILAETILTEIQKQNKVGEALFAITKNISQGELVGGSARSDIQASLEKLEIFDRWSWATGDWVYPIFTSISRNKSDRLMERDFQVRHTSACERSVTLTQKHLYDLVEGGKIRTLANALGLSEQINTLLPIQGEGDNVQYIRFIVPRGTTLITSDAGLTAADGDDFVTIQGYQSVGAGTKKSMTFRYLLSADICAESQETKFFKQPGLRNVSLEIQPLTGTLQRTYYE